MPEQAKQKLLNSNEFDNALDNAVEIKQQSVMKYKTSSKNLFLQFSELMTNNNDEIKEILGKKKNKRTEFDNNRIKEFNKELKAMFNQTVDLSIDEEKLAKKADGSVAEQKKSKAEKIVDKIVPVIKMLKYIGNNKLDNALEKAGIQIEFVKLEDENPQLQQENIKEAIASIFMEATKSKEDMLSKSIEIETEIYPTIPEDLQFDKDVRADGLKSSDFKKLVDVKTKLKIAKEKDPDKAKDTSDKIEQLAEDKQFEISRTELVRDKLLNIVEEAEA